MSLKMTALSVRISLLDNLTKLFSCLDCFCNTPNYARAQSDPHGFHQSAHKSDKSLQSDFHVHLRYDFPHDQTARLFHHLIGNKYQSYLSCGFLLKAGSKWLNKNSNPFLNCGKNSNNACNLSDCLIPLG